MREGLHVEFVECQGGNLVFKGSGAGRGNNMVGDITAVATDSNDNVVDGGGGTFPYSRSGEFTIYLAGGIFESGDYTLEVNDNRKKASTTFNSSC